MTEPNGACASCGAPSERSEERCRACGVPTLGTGARIADRYELIEVLGRGGMGAVFRARDHKLDEVVALKILRPDIMTREAERRFQDEIKLARRVAHRNVCRIFEYGEDGPLRFIVMEHVEGE